MDIADLKKKTISELNQQAKELEINGYSGLKKQELIFRILQARMCDATMNHIAVTCLGICGI